MKLHIFGAAGAGVTTLGTALAAAWDVPYFDTDDYYWLPTDPPFTQRRPAAERDATLTKALASHPAWVVGGSIVGWGEHWLRDFEAVVFLWLPPALRLHRLRLREQARYGAAIQVSATRAAQSAAFLTWAAGYDDGSCGGTRTLANHTHWLREFACPVLELRGDQSVAERVAAVSRWVMSVI